MERVKCVCGKLLGKGQTKFCCKECWLESPEMVKSLNTMGLARNKLKVRKAPSEKDNTLNYRTY